MKRMVRQNSEIGTEAASAIAQWKEGDRSAELAREIVFYFFYCNVEPPALTEVNDRTTEDLDEIAIEAIEAALGENLPTLLESLLVLGYVTWFAPWLFGDEEHWKAESQRFLTRAAAVAASEELRQSILKRLDRGGGGLASGSVSCAEEIRRMFKGEAPYHRYFIHIFGAGDEFAPTERKDRQR